MKRRKKCQANTGISSLRFDKGGILIGITLIVYFRKVLLAFSQKIFYGLLTGNLEALLNTGTNIRTIILISPLYSILYKLTHVVMVIIISALFFKVDFSNANFIVAIVFFIIAVVAFSGIGIITSAIVLIIKKSAPVQWGIAILLSLMSGAYFPIEFLPESIQNMALLNPLKHALDAIRLSLFKGHSFQMLKTQLIILSLIAIVLMPFSLFVFNQAVKKVKREGSLLNY